jgi:hypothetical protein
VWSDATPACLSTWALRLPLAPLQQGELRCIFVESQPIDRPYFAWTIADAATGVMESGETSVRSLLPLQPWAQ